MKSCISFVGLLAVGNCDHISQQRSPTNKRFRQFSNTVPISKHTSSNIIERSRKHPAIYNIRGGDTSTSSSTSLSVSATMASLFAGSIGGAIGVGISYPFDTLSTKAQVSTGKEGQQLSLTKSIGRIWKNEGVRGFFEGVLVTVSRRYQPYTDSYDISIYISYASLPDTSQFISHYLPSLYDSLFN